jgi:iron complex outermembrane receptor protein
MKTWNGLNAPWGLLSVGLVLNLAANAQELVSEAEYFSEQPVVLSASRLSQPVNRAPAAVTVITREMIEASGFRHLVDVLRLVPGFVVGWSGGNTPAATYLGLADALPKWMQIMVDGRSVYNPAYGQTYWRGIPLLLDDIDRIEVVRGPNAANDGLNSMLGTVHIFTRHSALTLGGMAEVAAGEESFREMNLRYGGEAGNGSWRLGLLGRQDERHGVERDHATDLQLSFRADYQPTRRDELMLQMGFSKGFWLGTNVAQLWDDHQEADFRGGHANLQWHRSLSQGRGWSLQLHHSYEQNKEPSPLPYPLDPLDGDFRISGSALQFTYLDQSRADLRTNLSGEYRLNRLRLPSLLGRDDYVEDSILRLSGAVEYSPSPEWVLHAAAMLEHHSDTDSTYLSPRLALNWLPSEAHAFRLGYSRGLSALSLYANNTDIKLTIGGVLYDQDTLSTCTLDPEQIESVELGYLFSKPEWHLNLDVRAFRNRISDILATEDIPFPDPDGETQTYVNKWGATQRGLEYQLKWHPGPESWLTLSQSWVTRDSDNTKNNNHVVSIPPQTLSLLASHRIGGIDVSLGYYRIGETFWIGGLREKLSKYNRLDLRLAKKWKVGGDRIEVALVFQSLLGDEFESFDAYEQQHFERRGYLSLKHEF